MNVFYSNKAFSDCFIRVFWVFWLLSNPQGPPRSSYPASESPLQNNILPLGVLLGASLLLLLPERLLHRPGRREQESGLLLLLLLRLLSLLLTSSSSSETARRQQRLLLLQEEALAVAAADLLLRGDWLRGERALPLLVSLAAGLPAGKALVAAPGRRKNGNQDCSIKEWFCGCFSRYG